MPVTIENIRALVDEPYFSRGESYYNEGLIYITAITEKKITAKSLGSAVYSTSLSMTRRLLDGHCSCPAYEDFGPCKHMAALGMAWRAENKGGYEPSTEICGVMSDHKNIRKILLKWPKNDLIDLIADLAYSHPEILDQIDE